MQCVLGELLQFLHGVFRDKVVVLRHPRDVQEVTRATRLPVTDVVTERFAVSETKSRRLEKTKHDVLEVKLCQ